MNLQDLEPNHNPKGGSPKSPLPIPVSEYDNPISTDGNTAVWTRTILQLVVTLFAAAALWFGLVGRVAKLEDSHKEDHETIIRIDTQGTRFSQSGIRLEDQIINQHELRIRAIEEEAKKLDVLIEKVNGIDSTVHEIKNVQIRK
jgi:hypothetical protein